MCRDSRCEIRMSRCRVCPTCGFVRNQRWRPVAGSRSGITHLHQLVCVISTKFQRLYLCFRGRATRLDYSRDCPICGFVRNQRWRPVTGSRYQITLISARIQNGNDIQTALFTVSESSNTSGLVRMLSDVNVSLESKMAAINWE